MSLISDALKKAQQDRENLQNPEDELPDLYIERHRDDSGIKKRIIFYGMILIILILAIFIIMNLANRERDSLIKAVNRNEKPITTVQPPQKTPVLAIKKSPEIPTPSSNAEISTSSTTKHESPVPATSIQPQIKTESKKSTPKHQEPKINTSTPTTTSIQIQKPEKIKKGDKIKIKPVETGINPVISTDELIREGDRKTSNQDYIGAVESYRKALETTRTSELYWKIYAAYSGMNNRVLARAFIDEGLKYFPDDFNLNKSSTVLYIRTKDFPRALASAKKAAVANPRDAHTYTYIGLCYFHMKDYTSALAQFQQSLELDSDAVENYYYTGLIFDNKTDYKRALEYYNAFLKLGSEDRDYKHKTWTIQRIKYLRDKLGEETTNEMR